MSVLTSATISGGPINNESGFFLRSHPIPEVYHYYGLFLPGFNYHV